MKARQFVVHKHTLVYMYHSSITRYIESNTNYLYTEYNKIMKKVMPRGTFSLNTWDNQWKP